MSKRSFKSCNSDEQKIRWRIKVRLKKLNRSWSIFRNDKAGIKTDYVYHWARIKRSILVIENCLQELSAYPRTRDRIHRVATILTRKKQKMEQYEEAAKHITVRYGLPLSDVVRSSEYRRTLKRHLRES